jgi:thiol-disulfide isomerase/thioredoxin
MKIKAKLIVIATITTIFSANCTKTDGSKSHLEKIVAQKVPDTLMKSQTGNLSEKYIYIDNFQDYQSIEDLIKYKDFENHVLYIDMWGVNCGPCIREFQYLKKLKERYKDKSIKFVYLADGPQKSCYHSQWKNIIINNELFGYHMPINSHLLKSIMSIKGYKTAGTMPHYILVNKNGEIVNPNALRPSSQEKIYMQIDKLL